jgi:hypothetical protein
MFLHLNQPVNKTGLQLKVAGPFYYTFSLPEQQEQDTYFISSINAFVEPICFANVASTSTTSVNFLVSLAFS